MTDIFLQSYYVLIIKNYRDVAEFKIPNTKQYLTVDFYFFLS